MIYYSTDAQGLTSNASALVETDHIRFLTGSTKSGNIVGLYATGRSATPGGNTIRVRRYGTPSTSGSAITPSPRDTAGTAVMTAFTGPTAGATPVQQLSFGFPATGGNGWVALEPNAGILLVGNGGANGNADVFSICNASSLALDLNAEHTE